LRRQILLSLEADDSKLLEFLDLVSLEAYVQGIYLDYENDKEPEENVLLLSVEELDGEIFVGVEES
jgi:hypothetical protein